MPGLEEAGMRGAANPMPLAPPRTDLAVPSGVKKAWSPQLGQGLRKEITLR